MKFLFALSGTYPTKKAYGVTTTETINALARLGHEVSTFSREDVNSQLIKLGYIGSLIVKLSERIMSNVALSKLYFPVWQFLFGLVSTKFFSDSRVILWVREPKLALIYSLVTRKRIICEIHHLYGFFSFVFVQILKRNRRVILAPIKEQIAKRGRLSPKNYPIAFMAVNKDFTSAGQERDFSRKICLNIAVVANVSNIHQLDSTKRLFQQINICLREHQNIKFTFVGIDRKKANEIGGLIKNREKVEFLGTLSHANVLNLLRATDIGIIPYLDNAYFLDTFPIKALEYAATSNLIVASETRSNRDLLMGKALFYDLNDDSGLSKVLGVALSQFTQRKVLMEAAFSWSTEYSYDARVNEILSKVLD